MSKYFLTSKQYSINATPTLISFTFTEFKNSLKCLNISNNSWISCHRYVIFACLNEVKNDLIVTFGIK